MKNNYRIEPDGNHFIVVDPWGEQLVDDFPTRKAAELDIERCKKEDRLCESAKLLVDTVVKAHMKINGVDRETAERWIRDAMGSA